MKLGIITYNKKHKKTQDVLKGLKKKKFKDITLLISKFKKIKKRKVFFKHRPNQFIGSHPIALKKRYNLKIKKLNTKNIKNLDKILICGSGLISKKILKNNKKIINCHSGLIPSSRGLDSFKWAIINSKKIGNTLHFIDKNVDLGRIISHKVTKLYKSDNLFSFAKRHYLNEINMLINFDKHIKTPNIIRLKKYKNTKRMPLKLEKKLDKIFLKYKNLFLKYHV